jgi:PGF-pre-PGF domain-containing protein
MATDMAVKLKKMKANFFNSIIYVSSIALIISIVFPFLAYAANDSANNSNLVLEGISTNLQYPGPTSAVTIMALVKNMGNESSSPTSLTYSIDGIESGETIDSIDTGDEKLIPLPPWVPGTEGTKIITAHLENTPDIQKQLSVIVAENQLSDLIIENIIPNISLPQEGNPLDFTVKVKNQGIAPSGTALAKYYINDTPGQDINIPSLAIGESTNLTFSLTSDQVKVGTMQVKVVADSGNNVSESNETNNELTIPVSVISLLPDLTIASLSWTPETPKIGENVVFTATIKNNGPGVSSSNKLRYSINETNDTAEVLVPALSAGGITQCNFSWIPEKEGNIEIKTVVDPDSIVLESTKSNNTLTKNVAVTKDNTLINERNEADSSSSSSFSSSKEGLLSKEPANNVAAKELVTRNVANGNHIRYEFLENSTCILYIEYDPKRTFLKTTTTVEELKNRSIFVSKNVSGRIYKYVNIWVGDQGGGLPVSFKNGLLGFRVDKSWINDNDINESLITLQWYNNSSWEPLYTEKKGEDNKSIYFKSKTPGYSSFAITENREKINENGAQFGAKLKNTLKNLETAGKKTVNGSANSQALMGAAKILMAISLPMFLIFIGYLVVKKRI